MTKVAVTGASGLLGRPLIDILRSDPDIEAQGAAFSRSGGALDRVDLLDAAAVETWLDRRMPDVLVHLAAERRPDAYAVDPEAADELNIAATRRLAGLCGKRDIPLLFLSTNYVFDGSSPPYLPDDAPNPLNAYGRSKLAGENAIIEASPLHRVLRIPMLFGPSENLAESSVTVIGEALRQAQEPTKFDVWQTRYPAYTPDVAEAIRGLVLHLHADDLPWRIFHFCSDEAMTKRDMAALIAPYLDVDPSLVLPDPGPPSGAPRPKEVHLSCPHLEELSLLRFTPFSRALELTMTAISAAGGLV